MQSNRNLFTQMVFSQSLGEKRTSLPVSAAVTYSYTLLCPSVAERTSHPIASSRLKAFAMVLVFSLVSGASLVGAPDPDIFDGRVTSSSESGGASSSTSEASSAEDEADAQASGGGSGSAQSSGSEANAQSGGSDSGATSSGVGAVAGEESSGASSGSGSGRDFSSIGGVGAGSAAEVLDINSSKASREPSGGFASPAIPDERVSADTSPSQDIGAGSGSGGSQTIPSVPKGDLGDAIPTGL